MPMRAVLVGAPVADPRRGETYEVNFDPAKGREQKGRRYCLVVSTDALNESGLGTAIVCPASSDEAIELVGKLEVRSGQKAAGYAKAPYDVVLICCAISHGAPGRSRMDDLKNSELDFE